MKYIRSFEEFISEGIVKKVIADKLRAKSLISESERKFISLKEQLEKIGIKDENANDYVEDCYNIIMPLIRAKMLLEGYNSSGSGAHEAEVAYMKLLGFEEKEVRFTNQIRFFRNGILCYGKQFDAEYGNKVIKFLNMIYPKLRDISKEALNVKPR